MSSSSNLVSFIFKIYNGYWFFGRPTIRELRQDLRAVLRKCRPDWDITTPRTESAWKRVEHNRFYPYGKTYGQVFRGARVTGDRLSLLSRSRIAFGSIRRWASLIPSDLWLTYLLRFCLFARVGHLRISSASSHRHPVYLEPREGLSRSMQTTYR